MRCWLVACYADAYGLQIVAGRSFSEEYGDDVDKLVINETAVRNLGFASNDEAIGELVTVECTDAPMQIIGVVKDYHQQALSKNYTPIMLIHKDKIDWLPQRYISVVMASGNPRDWYLKCKRSGISISRIPALIISSSISSSTTNIGKTRFSER